MAYNCRNLVGTAAFVSLLLAASLSGPVSAFAPAMPASRDGSSLETAQRISDLPGCGEAGSLQPATDTCSLTVQLSGTGTVRWLTFAISPEVSLEMTVTIMARTFSGAIDMMLWYPGESPTSSRASQFSTNAGFNVTSPLDPSHDPPASDIDYAYLAGREMVVPGVYTLLVAAKSGTPTVHLQVFTASALTRIAEEERVALKQLLSSCCPGWSDPHASDAHLSMERGWCGKIGRAMLEPNVDYIQDPCHIPPNMCTTDGHITQLILPGGGLVCPNGFPQELASFKSLRWAELSYNTFNSTAADVGKVVAQLPALESLILRGADIKGPLSCDLVGTRATGMRRSLVLSANADISGPIDPCFTSSPMLEELQLDGTGVEGALPPLAPNTPLRYLYLGAAPGKGKLTGSIPDSYGSPSRLQHLHLRGHALSGPIPRLPSGLQLLDVAHNRLSGPFPDLSSCRGLDYIDASHNSLGGEVPCTLDNDAPALDYLDLSYNNLGGRLENVRLPASLVYADLQGNEIGGQLWGSVEGFGNLVELNLANNTISGSLKPSIAASQTLMRLDLSRNQLSGDLSSFAAALERRSSNSIVHFNASHNALSGAVPAGLARLAVFEPLPVKSQDGTIQDRRFDLSGNRLVGAFPSFIGQAIPAMEASCRCAYRIMLPEAAPLACPNSLPSPLPQAGNVLHSRVPDMTCEGRDAHGTAKRVPLWTLVTRGEAPTAGPASRPSQPAAPQPQPPSGAAAAPPPAGGPPRLNAAARAGVALGVLGFAVLLVAAGFMARPFVQDRLLRRRESRLTSALVGCDGACEITVLPPRGAEGNFQLADVKSRGLDKEGVV